MKVCVVEKVYPYEAGAIVGIFETEEVAREWVRKEIIREGQRGIKYGLSNCGGEVEYSMWDLVENADMVCCGSCGGFYNRLGYYASWGSEICKKCWYEMGCPIVRPS